MKKIVTPIGLNVNEIYTFDCYENTEPIEIGDQYIYLFWGTYEVLVCASENERFEINVNSRVANPNSIDLVTNFWQNCYKIKSTDFDYKKTDDKRTT